MIMSDYYIAFLTYILGSRTEFSVRSFDGEGYVEFKSRLERDFPACAVEELVGYRL